MAVIVDKQALLAQELQRVAVVLHDASLEQYEAAVAAVTQAIEMLPDVLPDADEWPKKTSADRFATESRLSRPVSAAGSNDRERGESHEG